MQNEEPLGLMRVLELVTIVHRLSRAVQNEEPLGLIRVLEPVKIVHRLSRAVQNEEPLGLMRVLELVTIVHRLSRAVQNEEPLGSNYVVAADFNPLGMLRNHLRAVGSAHIQSFQIFKNVSFIM